MCLAREKPFPSEIKDDRDEAVTRRLPVYAGWALPANFENVVLSWGLRRKASLTGLTECTRYKAAFALYRCWCRVACH